MMHGLSYTKAPPRRGGRRGACWIIAAVLLAAQSVSGSVVISEIMYHPSSDDEGHDFLELHNSGAAAEVLSNWCVDGLGFCFPPGASIPANGYLVLARDAAKFQTKYGFAPSFVYDGTLSNSGELLTLLNALGQTIDVVEYDDTGLWPPRADGLGPSLERIVANSAGDTPRNWAACTAPSGHSASAANSVAAANLPPWITETQHSPAVVPATAPITITARIEDATSVQVTYQYDFQPTETADMFDDGAHGDGGAADGVFGYELPGQPINRMVRYQITATGPTGTMRSPRVDDTINFWGTYIPDPSVTSVAPIFHWIMDPVDYQDAINNAGSPFTEPACLYYDGVFYDNIGVRVRGQSSTTWPKKNWAFKFPQGHDFFATGLTITAADNFDLQSHYSDKAYCREILANETFSVCGSPASQGFHVRLEKNGSFYGIYTCLEDHDNKWIERWGFSTDGARYKAFSDLHDFGSEAILHGWYEKDSRLYENYSDLYALIVGLNHLTGQALTNFLYDNIDIPAMANYLATTIVVHNNDHPHKNYILYRDTTGTQRWEMFSYDLDLTFGRNYGAGGGVLSDGIWADVDAIEGLQDVSPSHPLFGDRFHQKYDLWWNRMIDRLLADPKFRQIFYRRLRTVMDQLLASAYFESRIDQLTLPLTVEAELDRQTWGQYGQAQSLAEAVDILKTQYLVPRRTHLFVTHQVPGEIPSMQSAQPNIVINEIMYRPSGSESAGEFIELYNPSATESVDLSFWKLDGVNLTIPPGTVILPQDFALLVRNDLAFRNSHGPGLYIASSYSGDLNNAGEHLVLRDATGRVVDSVFYEPNAPWPAGANGAGPSLELIDATQDNSRPSNWAASLLPGGTPGLSNSQVGSTPALPALFINEALPVNTSVNTDESNEFAPWIELYNAGTATIDLGGMTLTDNYAVPAMWTIPTGTELCEGEWLIIWADNEPGEGPLHASFALTPTAGSVGLYTSMGTLIDYLNYPALAANTSYGRYPDAGVLRASFAVATPAAANQATKAPLILNEYNAVAPTGFLKNAAADTYLGRVMGNGGDWFELVVTENHLDIRGWQLVTLDNPGPSQTTQTLTFTNHPLLADLRSGTIITISEAVPDVVNYSPINGDWWINLQSGPAGSGVYLSAVDFEVSHRNWTVTILNGQGGVEFGPAGEGVFSNSGIGNDEICKLEDPPGFLISPLSNYDDGESSTFGSPNIFNGGTETQDFSALRSQVVTCVSSEGCSDGDPCTIDTCINGECYHTPAAPCYQLRLDVVPAVGPMAQVCPSPFDVQVELSATVEPLTQVQFLMHYDPLRLTLLSISPGDGSGSPWDAATPVVFTDDAGAVLYALSLGGSGSSATAVVATLHMTALDPDGALDPTLITFDPPVFCAPAQTEVTTAASQTVVPATIDAVPIIVGPRLEIEVQVEGLSHAVTRDVTFVLTTCGGPPAQTITRPVTFDSTGLGTVTLMGIDPEADWIAAVEGHTLKRRVPLTFNACFAAVSFTGVNRLLAGDLHTAGTPQDGLVDILDFAILAARWNTICNDCVSGPPANCSRGADVTGDSLQETADFTALQINFFKTGDGDADCPPAPIWQPPDRRPPPTDPGLLEPGEPLAPAPRGSVPTADLAGSVFGIESVDLNADGVIDAADVRAFAAQRGLTITAEFDDRLRMLESTTSSYRGARTTGPTRKPVR